MSSEYFSTVINDKAADVLRRMIASGFWGDGETEVVGNLLLHGIREAISGGLVMLAVTAEEEEDPEAPPPQRPHKCEHCHDGLKAIPDETPEGNCPKCGQNVEIPF